MSIGTRLAAVLAGATAITLIALACGGPTSTEIVQTQTALNKEANATATANAVATAGGDVKLKVAFEVGKGSIAEHVQLTQAAKATAAVASGEAVAGASSGATVTPVPEVVAEAPEGPAQSGDVEILIIGRRRPEIILFKSGPVRADTAGRGSGPPRGLAMRDSKASGHVLSKQDHAGPPV